MKKPLTYHLATVFGLGDLLPAPGTTAGSFPTAVFFFGLVWLLGITPWLGITLTVCVIVSIIAGIWAAEQESLRRGAEDPGPVVIDEVAGQLITYLCGIFVLGAGVDLINLVLFVGAGFFLFRFFDILKPWPINRLERLPGGFGIMADDLVAGLDAGVCLAIAWYFWLGRAEIFSAIF